MKQASISICNQKGGIGKSTFTMLLASHLHYTLGYDVLVVDCDYPQWSVQAQRERELSLIEHDDYHKLLLVRQFKATGRKLWPVLKCMPPEAPEEVERLLQSGYHPRIILYDLPGTVNDRTDGHSAARVAGRCLCAHESRQGRHGKYALLCPESHH